MGVLFLEALKFLEDTFLPTPNSRVFTGDCSAISISTTKRRKRYRNAENGKQPNCCRRFSDVSSAERHTPMQSVAASGASTSKKRGSSAPAAVSKYPRLVLTRSGRETSAPPTASPAYPRFVLTRSGRETSAPPTAPPAPAAPPETGSQQFRDNHSSASGSNGLTEEQQKVVNCCLGRNLEKGNVVLITAGAGTGKTTTLQKCVHRLIELKHTRIKYLTFNKAAAADAQARFRRENYGTKVVCNCSTFHSGVIECWRESRSRLGKMIDEKKLKELIKEKLGGDVRRFLRPYLQNQDNSEGQKKMAFAQVLFFIEKQFEQKILWDDGEIAIENADDFATYYPARLWHDKEKKRGLPLPKNFYIESGQKVWGLLTQSDERNASWTFDSIIKDVQLAKLELLYDVILVDEFQDLTRCMIALLLHQAEKFKKQVFFVGDANQLIYRFRGARDSNMDMFFEDSREFNLSRCQLTRSFRFGSQIAHAANTILFVKEKSRQRNPGYELVGGGRNVDAHVTRCQLTVKDHGKITVLAATNLSLFEYVIRLFGEGSTCPSDIGGMHVELPSFPHSIAILGKGEGSGKGKWNKLVKEINTFIDLYQGSKINQKVFHENFSDLCLDDQDASWDSVCKIINNHDLNKYCTHVALVEKYKEQTRGLVDMFCERCLNNEVDER